MKKILLALLTLICILCSCLFACADSGNDGGKGEGTQTTEDSGTDGNKTDECEMDESGGLPSQNEETSKEQNNMYLKIGNSTLTATLVENSATEELKERLKTAPITIDMSDYGGWEKVGGFGFNLPTSNEQITAQPCEFVLYQGNQLVIFYGSNSWSYTMLGKIEGVTQAELKAILGTGSVAISLSLEK